MKSNADKLEARRFGGDLPLDERNGIEIDAVAKRFFITGQPIGRIGSFFAHRLLSRGEREELWALRDVTFNVQRGEVLGIVGANGSGKSTLLKIITGISDPTAGTVRRNRRVAALLDLTAGFHPSLTGYENLFLGASLQGISRDETRERLAAIIEFSGIDPKFLDVPVRCYSTGMITRLGMSLAVNTDPEIVLIDEVLSVGDPEFQQRSARRLLQFRDQGKTMILVTHVLGAVHQVCERTVWLKDGRVEAIGPSAEVIRDYRAYLNGRVRSHQAEQEMVHQADRGQAVCFGDASLFDSQGKPCTKFDVGGALRCRATVSSPQPLRAVDAVVTVLHDTGTIVEQFALAERNVKLPDGAREYDIDIELKPLMLLPGRFAVSVALTSNEDYSQVLAHSADAWFEVVGDYSNEPGSPCCLPWLYEMQAGVQKPPA